MKTISRFLNIDLQKARQHMALIALIFMFLTGLMLRSRGLSHDLDIGNIYHPDTPKQILATKAFLNGIYYFKMSNINYDGYPYFNSHLTEYIYRIFKTGSKLFRHHLGIRAPLPEPSRNTLFWITRLLNVTLSSLVILLVFQIGKEYYNRRVGLLAALFITVSPLDVVTCHYATSDTTAGFFIVLALLFAGRIYRRGKTIDYICAAVTTAFAFSAKYNGGIAIAPCIIAHVMRYGSLRSLYSRKAITLVAVSVSVAIVAFILATPSMLVEPVVTIKDIIGFFRYTANFGMNAELADMSISARWFYALRHNFPGFVMILGPILIPVILIGIPVEIWRDKKAILLAAMLFLYVLVCLPFKPMAHAQYHLLIIPPLIVIAAAVLTQTANISRYKPLPLIMVFCLSVAAVFGLLRRTIEENFFFARSDTRQLAAEWLEKNVLDSFYVTAGDYTLPCTPENKETTDGCVMFTSSWRPHQPPREYALMQQFDLKDASIAPFRNPPITAYIYDSSLILHGCMTPVFQRYPCSQYADIVLNDETVFHCSGKVFYADPKTSVEKYLYADRQIKNALVIIRCGSLPVQLNALFGGHKVKLVLGPSDTVCLPVDFSPAFRRMGGGGYFYKISANAILGKALIMIATTPIEKGTALFNIGKRTEAYPYLMKALELKDNPTLAAMTAIASRDCEKDRVEVNSDTADLVKTFKNTKWTKSSLFSVYGISMEYLDRIPFASFNSNDIKKYESVSMSGMVATPTMILEHGSYCTSINLSETAGTNRNIYISLIDDRTLEVLAEKICSTSGLINGNPRKQSIQFHFHIPSNINAVRILAGPFHDQSRPVISIKISPDPIGTLISLQTLLKTTDSLANQARVKSKADKSMPAPAVACDAVFRNEAILKAFRINKDHVVRGESFIMNFYWQVFPKPFTRHTAVWVHFVNDKDRVMFQGDHNLINDLPLRIEDGITARPESCITVPADIPAGCYKIKAGLYIPMQKRHIKLQSSLLPDDGNSGVILGTLTVTDQESEF